MKVSDKIDECLNECPDIYKNNDNFKIVLNGQTYEQYRKERGYEGQVIETYKGLKVVRDNYMTHEILCTNYFNREFLQYHIT